jgi:hypothetical protein
MTAERIRLYPRINLNSLKGEGNLSLLMKYHDRKTWGYGDRAPSFLKLGTRWEQIISFTRWLP